MSVGSLGTQGYTIPALHLKKSLRLGMYSNKRPPLHIPMVFPGAAEKPGLPSEKGVC